jgi:hypothetical protein
MNGIVKSELHALLDKLTPDEIAGLLAAVEDDRILGNCFWDPEFRCGCIYGTATVMRNAHLAESSFGTDLIESTLSIGDLHPEEYTALERYAFHVSPGEQSGELTEIADAIKSYRAAQP